jgi:hypothetical protein
MVRFLMKTAFVAFLFLLTTTQNVSGTTEVVITGIEGSAFMTGPSGFKRPISHKDHLTPGVALDVEGDGYLVLEEEATLRVTLFDETRLVYPGGDREGDPALEISEGVALVQSLSPTLRTITLPSLDVTFREATLISIVRSDVSTLFVLSGLVQAEGPEGYVGFLKSGFRMIATPDQIISRGKFTPGELAGLVNEEDLRQATNEPGWPMDPGLALLRRDSGGNGSGYWTERSSCFRRRVRRRTWREGSGRGGCR